MLTNGEDGSCERNMRPHNKDNELSIELTYFLGDVSDCEPFLHLFLIPTLDGMAGFLWCIINSNPCSLVLCLHDSLQSVLDFWIRFGALVAGSFMLKRLVDHIYYEHIGHLELRECTRAAVR
jgi:hypothetical protein